MLEMGGDPVVQADIWKAHDPSDSAAALNGTSLYVAYGNGQIGELGMGSAFPSEADGSTEAEVATESAAFVHQLAAPPIPVTVDAYGNRPTAGSIRSATSIAR